MKQGEPIEQRRGTHPTYKDEKIRKEKRESKRNQSSIIEKIKRSWNGFV